jgi:hypothetical protein
MFRSKVLTYIIHTGNHGMARPQIADKDDGIRIGKTVKEYVEQAKANSRQGVLLQLSSWEKGK